MAGNAKPRKKYVPKSVKGALPISIRHPKVEQDYQKYKFHQALSDLRSGKATDNDIGNMALRLAVCTVLAKALYQGEPVAIMEKGIYTLEEVKCRFHRVGKWGALPAELDAIGAALLLADELQDATTRREQKMAAEAIYKSFKPVKK
jgi:hypothetical protein